MALVGEGRCADAVRLIRKDNPFPTACAYICEHPCEARCRRNMVDDAINIRGLKRYAVDHAGWYPSRSALPPPAKKGGHHRRRPQRSQLRLLPGPYGSRGHGVRGAEQLGGMLRYGIPSYRFPREKLDAEIESILSLGIEVHTGVTVGRDIWLEKLEQEYDCIYIAIGAHQDKKDRHPGENSKNVISAVEMLRAIGDNEMPDFTGKQVVVIGGGNVAMDVTRSSIRLGADKVTCVYRRRQADMTALPDEITGALAEGAELMTLAAPVRIEADEDGAAKALWVQPQIIGEVDKAGRPVPARRRWRRSASRRMSSWWPSDRASRSRASIRRGSPSPGGPLGGGGGGGGGGGYGQRVRRRRLRYRPCHCHPGHCRRQRWQPPTSTSIWASATRSPWMWRFPSPMLNNSPPPRAHRYHRAGGL